MKASKTANNSAVTKNIIKPAGFCILVLIVCWTVLLPAVLPLQAWGAVSDLRSRARIELGNISSGYVLLELPDEVLSQTQSGLPDLRIYSAEDEIPYALLKDADFTPAQKYEQTDILNRASDDQDNLVFELKIPQEKWVDQVVFISSDQNFIRRVAVEGSWDQQAWVTLAANSTIFDLSAEKKSRHLEVNLMPTNYSYLRVTIINEGKGSFQLEGAELSYVNQTIRTAALKERPYDLSKNDSQEGVQEYTLDLYAPFPSRELEIYTNAQNFNRTMEIYAGSDKKDWNLLTSGEIYSYRLDNLTAQQLKLRFHTELRYLRLKIYNQDNPPLDIGEIKIRGINPALLFSADPAKEYYLYWNSSQIRAAVYDVQKFKENLDYNKLPRANLDPAEENEAYQFKYIRPWTERNSWLLQLMLILVVVVLTLAIIQSVRKIAADKQK
ncbi:MAG TPA: DUF3999 family protein [Desulfitobacteriaceae bacterium]|nr:DUF3999 family protein [Desulfitobacteriaceae bacterium]